MATRHPKSLRPIRDRRIEREMAIQLVGDVLVGIMAAEGLSKAADLARRTGKRKRQIRAVLRGDRNLSIGEVSKLFYALGYRLQVSARPLSDGKRTLKVVQ